MKYKAMVWTLALTSAAAMGAAQAEVEDLQVNAQSINTCNAPRGIDAQQINFRPILAENTSTQNAYIACGFATTSDAAELASDPATNTQTVSYFGSFFRNASSTEQQVNCTGVEGYAGSEGTVYYPATVAVEPNATASDPNKGYIFWAPATGDLFYQLVAFACILPPQVGVADTYVSYKMMDDV